MDNTRSDGLDFLNMKNTTKEFRPFVCYKFCWTLWLVDCGYMHAFYSLVCPLVHCHSYFFVLFCFVSLCCFVLFVLFLFLFCFCFAFVVVVVLFCLCCFVFYHMVCHFDFLSLFGIPCQGSFSLLYCLVLWWCCFSLHSQAVHAVFDVTIVTYMLTVCFGFFFFFFFFYLCNFEWFLTTDK